MFNFKKIGIIFSILALVGLIGALMVGPVSADTSYVCPGGVIGDYDGDLESFNGREVVADADVQDRIDLREDWREKVVDRQRQSTHRGVDTGELRLDDRADAVLDLGQRTLHPRRVERSGNDADDTARRTTHHALKDRHELAV